MDDVSDNTIKKDLILRDLYYSPKTGFRSRDHILELAKKEDSSITKDDVENWLQKQKAYSKYKTFNNPHHLRHTFVRYLGEQVQMDLIVLGKNFESGDFKFILMAIEILSRYGFAVPLKGKSADITLEGIKIFLKEFEDKFHEKPKLIQFDEGREFLNKKSSKFFKDEDITIFVTFSKRKASIVERMNRTVKEKIVKYIESTGKSNNWIKVLPDIIENYNTQKHSSIGMSPSEVNEKNQFTVWGRLFGSLMNYVKTPRFKVGDRVRVLHFNPKGEKLQKYFREKYPPEINPKTGKKKRYVELAPKNEAPFSNEIFRITHVLIGDPVVYKLFSDDADVEILGKFYEDELSLVKKIIIFLFFFFLKKNAK